jgi:hypothetical protein
MMPFDLPGRRAHVVAQVDFLHQQALDALGRVAARVVVIAWAGRA